MTSIAVIENKISVIRKYFPFSTDTKGFPRVILRMISISEEQLRDISIW